MLIIPAIDLKNGRCVRLVQGRANDETVYSEDPIKTALRWQEEGARLLHVVDLDGAFEGRPKNLDIVVDIAQTLDIPVQMGGGIRSLEAVEEILENGVERVILGTVAITHPQLVAAACHRFGERILVGIDARDGKVAVQGWTETTERAAVDLARDIQASGVKEIVFTDIARDGMLTGPNLPSLENMVSTGLRVIASGGVGSLDDIRRVSSLQDAGVVGVIVGKALYTGDVKLTDAVRATASAT